MSERDLPLRWIGLTSILLLLVATVVIFSGVFREAFKGDRNEVTADFERAPQLRKGDQVRIDGNLDGEVTEIKASGQGEAARVTMEVEDDAGPIYADARARLKIKTLLGGAFYVDLDRGTPGAGSLGDKVIPLARTNVQVEVEDVTDIFRGQAVKGFRQLPGEFATALSDAPPVARSFDVLADIAPDAGTALEALRGEEKGDLRRLVQSASRAVDVLDTGNEDLRTLVSGAAATLQVTGNRSAQLRQAIDEGPEMTNRLRGTLGRLDGTLEKTRGLVRRLDPAASDIAPTLTPLRPNLISADKLLDEADITLKPINTTLEAIYRTTPKGTRLVRQITPALRTLDKKIVPSLGKPDPRTGQTTTVMIGGTAAGFGGAGAQMDENGHFIRFPASVGSRNVYLPCQSSIIDQDAASVLACESLQQAFASYLGYFGPFTGGKLAASKGKSK